MSERIAVNKPIGRDINGDIYIARDFFDHGDGFRGVTCDTVYPVTQAMVDEALTDDFKAEYFEEVWRADAGSSNGTELGLEEWIAEIPDDEILEMVYETADVDVEELNALSGNDAARYALSGCGRVFHANTEWARVFDADLLARINAWEGN